MQNHFFVLLTRMDAHTAIHIGHLAVIGPLLTYVGLARDNTPAVILNSLGVTAVAIFFYHCYRAYGKLKENKSAWVNWIHILFVAPLLFLVAYLKKDASRRYYEMILLLGVAAIGYHGIYLARDYLQM